MAMDDELPPADRAGAVRVAFAIGRPVGNAVTRNRLRRQLREALRSLDDAGAVARGRYLVLVSPGAALSSFTELRDHLSRLVPGPA